MEKQKNIEGGVFLVLFCLTIPLANWMIGHVGVVCPANGPCLLPVAPHLMAPSGVLMIGIALVLRDLVQRRLGVEFGLAAIVAGAAISALLAPPSLVLASAAAFLLVGIRRFRGLYAARPPPPCSGGSRLKSAWSCGRLDRVPVARLWLARLSGWPNRRQALDGAARHALRRLSSSPRRAARPETRLRIL